MLGEDWAWAQPLLRETGTLASRYPKLGPHPESSRPYQVVCHRAVADDYVGVCPDETGTIPLRAADLRLHAIDARALARLVAGAMELVADHGDAGAVPNAVRAGIANAMAGDGEEWVYVFTGAHPGELAVTAQALAAHHDYPFVLLTATKSAWRGWPDPLRKRGRLVAMNEVFGAPPGGGGLAVVRPPDAPFRRHVRPSQGMTDAQGSRRADGVEPPGELPGRNERVVLEVLATAGAPMIQLELVEATRLHGRRLSRKTVGPALQSLAGRGLVEYPEGLRKGVRITDAGRELLSRLPAARADGSH
jgi:hypothetical protein